MGFKEITIQNFRGLENLPLKFAPHFNLLLGRGNVGKTSVLEALFLLMGINAPGLSMKVMTWRGLPPQKPEDLKWIFHADKEELPISLQGDSFDGLETRKLTIFKSAGGNSGVESSVKKTPLEKLQSNGHANLIIQPQSGKRFEDFVFLGELNDLKMWGKIRFSDGGIEANADYKEEVRGLFQHVSSMTNNQDLMVALEQIVVSKKKPDFIDALRQIEPLLMDIEQAGDTIYVRLENLRNLLPIQNMGTGFLKVFSHIAAAMSPMVDIVLVDEIADGLHYSELEKILKAIMFAAEQSKTQVIATTHSQEALQACQKILDDDKFKNLRKGVYCNYLQRDKKGQVQAYGYDYDAFAGSIRDGIELR